MLLCLTIQMSGMLHMFTNRLWSLHNLYLLAYAKCLCWSTYALSCASKKLSQYFIMFIVFTFSLIRTTIISSCYWSFVQRVSLVICQYCFNNYKLFYGFIIVVVCNSAVSFYLGLYTLLWLLVILVLVLLLFLLFMIALDKNSPTDKVIWSDVNPQYPIWFILAIVLIGKALTSPSQLDLLHVLMVVHLLIYLIVIVIICSLFISTFMLSTDILRQQKMPKPYKPGSKGKPYQFTKAFKRKYSTWANRTQPSNLQQPINMSSIAKVSFTTLSPAPVLSCSFSTYACLASSYPPVWDANQYFKLLREVDLNKPTVNPHILVNRFIATGKHPTPDIINTVLSLHSGALATQELIDWFDTIKPTQFDYPIRPSDKESFALLTKLVGPKKYKDKSSRTSGVYIVSKHDEWYVGGALDLQVRPWAHLKPSSKGRCHNWVHKHNREGFTINLYPLSNKPDFVKHYEAADLTAMFEQYLTIIKNPNVNHGKVANMTSSEFSQERLDAMREKQGVPVYMYFDGVLKHKFGYFAEPGRLLGYGDSWCNTVIINGGVVRDRLKFTRKPIPGSQESLITAQEFVSLFKSLIGRSHSDPTKVTMFNIETGAVLHYDSLTSAGVAHGTIHKSVRSSFLVPGSNILKPVKHHNGYVYIETVDNEELMQQTYQYIRDSTVVSTQKPFRITMTRLSDGLTFNYSSLGHAQKSAFIDLGLDWKPYWLVREARVAMKTQTPVVFNGIEITASY